MHLDVKNFYAFWRLLSDDKGVFEVLTLFGRESSEVALLVGEYELFILLFFLLLLVDRLRRIVIVEELALLRAWLRIRCQTENIIGHGPLLPPALLVIHHIVVDLGHMLERQWLL